MWQDLEKRQRGRGQDYQVQSQSPEERMREQYGPGWVDQCDLVNVEKEEEYLEEIGWEVAYGHARASQGLVSTSVELGTRF